jgi:membrane fusion protein (multidrug efflux system)
MQLKRLHDRREMLDQVQKDIVLERPDDDPGLGSRRPGNRSARPFILLGAILLVLVICGVLYWLNARKFATTDDAQLDGAIHRIAARIAGQVQIVLVHQNQHVTQGQLLVRLDPRTEQTALDRARAEAAQAAAQISLRQADVTRAEANIAVAAANLLEAQQNYNRYRSVNPRAITRQQIDNATATLRAMTARANVAQQQVTGAKAAVVAARAALKAAQVAVETARLQASYTEIRAPVSGYIAQRSVRSGNVVAAGAGLMAVVADRIWVTANYKETELGRIHPGQNARIYIDAVPGVAFHAKVASIQRGTGSVFSLLPAENATGNYVKIVQRVPVRLVFDDKRIGNYILSPGMSAEPYIRIAPH